MENVDRLLSSPFWLFSNGDLVVLLSYPKFILVTCACFKIIIENEAFVAYIRSFYCGNFVI